MNAMSGKAGLVLGLVLGLAGFAPAHAQIPSPLDAEVLVVEPLNTQLFSVMQADIGFQNLLVAEPAKVPETICGNPGGSPVVMIDCFEFALTYVTYDDNGKQFLHLPECNAVPFNHSDCMLPVNNLCSGNVILDPFQIKAPVCGVTEVEIIPLSEMPESPLTSVWDGVSTSKSVFLYTAREGGIDAKSAYRTELIRVPAWTPTIPGASVALLIARHQDQIGFFSPLKRNVVFNQQLGNLHDMAVVPVLFLLP